MVFCWSLSGHTKMLLCHDHRDSGACDNLVILDDMSVYSVVMMPGFLYTVGIKGSLKNLDEEV